VDVILSEAKDLFRSGLYIEEDPSLTLRMTTKAFASEEGESGSHII